MSRSLVLLVLRDTVRRPPFRPPVSPRMSSESMVEASRALVAVLGGDLCRADLFLHLQRVLLVLGPAGVRVLGSGLRSEERRVGKEWRARGGAARCKQR